eukprot:SRR837773.12823.p1 GENE.SRR837773.12823~~SRR837773.12823.p1  ORF type:complete len:597 (+),score=136.54 SRR837773.12823:113-1792(+)
MVELKDAVPQVNGRQRVAPAVSDPYPELEVETSVAGIESAKAKATAHFSQGRLDLAVRWFSKAIWLVDSKQVEDAPADLVSILHSNRALAHVKSERWSEAEKDCDVALTLNAGNTKAKYRRAQARSKCGKAKEALEDLEQVMKELPDAHKNEEAMELKRELEAAIAAAVPVAAGSGAQADFTPSSCWAGPKHGMVFKLGDKGLGYYLDKVGPKRPAPAVDPKEPFPEIQAERTTKGVEAVKDIGNRLFAEGAMAEAKRHFSKCLWLLESGAVSADTNEARNLKAILFKNRGFVEFKLTNWTEAEKDCSCALQLQPNDVKALYRRSLARMELQKFAGALEDVEAALKHQPGNEDLQALRRRAAEAAAPKAVEQQKASPASAKPLVAEVTASRASPQHLDSAVTAAPASKAAPSSPGTGSGKSSPSSTPSGGRVRAPIVPRGLPTPSVPSVAPKTGSEMLRHLHSMKRYPGTMAQYIVQRVPPALLAGLFSRAPLEADDLALVLGALQTNLSDPASGFSHESGAEYLRALLKTQSAETQFTMLSSTEQAIIQQVLSGATCR